MENGLCLLWLIPFALGIACLALWTSPLPWEPESGDASAQDPVRSEPAILWLSPAARMALGRCADPKRLSRMTAEQIARRLETSAFGDLPSRSQYQTWPAQARLLISGDQDTLLKWQRSSDPDAPDEVLATEPDPPSRRRRHLVRQISPWLGLAGLALLVLALALYWLLRCGTNPAPDSPKEITATKRIETWLPASTDAFFDYNRADFYSPEHKALLRVRLFETLRRFDKIHIVRVDAHTDPIGGQADNNRLGKARAGAVISLIKDLLQSPDFAQHFSSTEIEEPTSESGPDAIDKAFWAACFHRYQLQVPLNLRPLVDLSTRKNQPHRPLCSQAGTDQSNTGPYPACANFRDAGTPMTKLVALGRAENFRELTSCLAPMRHVVIRLTHVVAGPSAPAAASAAQPKV